LGGSSPLPSNLVVVKRPDGQVAVRLEGSEGPEIKVNGVTLGQEPSPLLHGDKVSVGEIELTFVDERRSGSTQFVSADDIAKLQALGSKKKLDVDSQAYPTTGGRLVSLSDGREYEVTGSLVFGRDAKSDVVITEKLASRRHAEITSTEKGYLLVDSSSNGTFVNGERVERERFLFRADVIRIGNDEFRFYADKVAAAPVQVGPPQSAPLSSPPPPPAPAPGAEQSLRDTMHGFPTPSAAVEPAAAAPAPQVAPPSSSGSDVLGNLIVRNGRLQGHRYPIRMPIVNVGRAEYNDIVVAEASVSSQHCKIQLREGIWFLQDLGSTNGSEVDGMAVADEAPLVPGSVVKLGDVMLTFESTKDDSAEMGGGTQVLGKIQFPPAGS
ncbi:MAG: FHA domain-containing protein, partial [Gemmatimonadota bacterium]|nr:FHA domain-containing protein [Gemmatimonadota bacterium]